MLEVQKLNAGYGSVQVLRDISLAVGKGEILCLLGRNGAGKTTLMKAIMGLLRAYSGKVVLEGREISTLPAHQVPRRGVAYVPQGRRLFSAMTVAENLQIGLMAGDRGQDAFDHALELFPRLRERLNQRAETLSGGEQQMLATARALCLKPKVMLLDEPTEGLQPSMIALIRSVIVELKQRDVAVLLVEQRVEAVLEIADRIAFIENGQVALETEPSALEADESLIHRYVGV